MAQVELVNGEIVEECYCEGHLHDGDQQSYGLCYTCFCTGDWRAQFESARKKRDERKNLE